MEISSFSACFLTSQIYGKGGQWLIEELVPKAVAGRNPLNCSDAIELPDINETNSTQYSQN